MPVARLIRSIRGILDGLPNEGHDEVLEAWKFYLERTDARFAGPEHFASRWKTFVMKHDREIVKDEWSD